MLIKSVYSVKNKYTIVCRSSSKFQNNRLVLTIISGKKEETSYTFSLREPS